QPLDQVTVRLEEDGGATIISSMAAASPTFLQQSQLELKLELEDFGQMRPLSVVNALCECFILSVHEMDSQWHTLLFEQGSLRSSRSHLISLAVSNDPLWLRLWPDFTVLEPGSFDEEQVRELMRALSSDHDVAITVVRG